MKTRTAIGMFLSILAAGLLLLAVGCGHHSHHGGGGVSPPSPNPAIYAYEPTLIAEHQPGFFSACWNGGKLWLGTYQDYRNKMHCQLCVFDGAVRVVKVFDGESIYNISPIDGHSLFLPVEQGHLYGYSDHAWVIHPKHLRMGHYCVGWWNGKWVTSEKDTITTHNKSQIWVGGKLLFESSDFTWKEFVVKGDLAYIAAYFVWKRTEAGMLTVNMKTGEPNLVLSKRWGNYSIVGEYKGDIYYGIQFGKEMEIYKYPNTLIQRIPDIGWRFKSFGEFFFLTAAENGWRKDGPCYLYVWDTAAGRFVKKLQLRDAEPWDIVRAGNNVFYLVTGNEDGNIGRVYKITVK